MVKKVLFKITGMHCTSCAFNIDGELEDTQGVKSASTSYAKQVTEVEYDAKKINEKKIIAIINNAGYTAEQKL